MRELIETVKDFKIIPENFLSATSFDVIKADDEIIEAHLNQIKPEELADYKIGSNVEVFGVNSLGLVYFETKIINKDNENITLSSTNDYSLIQRREYSRVNLNKGEIIFNDECGDIIKKVEDISAGGIKLISKIPLEQDKEYKITIRLSNNLNINCTLVPIRIKEKDKDAYIVSGKFSNLHNADRTILVQYAFKIKMEEQNKENE